MFENWRREHRLRRVLRQLSRQRVALVFQPANIWVVERSPERNEEMEAALRTCHIRGWVEVIENAVPTGRLRSAGSLPPGNPFEGIAPVYRLTQGGWQVINRTYTIIAVTCVVAMATFVAAIIGICLSLRL